MHQKYKPGHNIELMEANSRSNRKQKQEESKDNHSRYESRSSMEFYDVIAHNSFLESEPTIIDAWRAFLQQCCGCCYYTDVNAHSSHLPIHHDFGSFEDEVEKAMHERKHSKVRELETALIENEIASNSISVPKSKSKATLFQSGEGARMRCYCIPCLGYKPTICQLVTVTVMIQTFALLLMAMTDTIHDKERHHYFRLMFGVFIGFLLFSQVIVLVQLVLICFKKLWDLTFFEIIILYLSSILVFTGAYTSAYFFDDDDKRVLGPFEAFNFRDTEFKSGRFGERVIAFLYFSCSQQTLCGVCEIIPKSPPTQFLAASQMFFGIFFSIIIISIGISRLGEDVEKRRSDMIRDAQAMPMERADRRTCWQLVAHNERLIKLRRTVRKYLLLIVIIIQATKNVLEWFTTNSHFATNHTIVRSLLFVIFDIINILAVITTSVKFLHIGHMTELKISFLCQTYLSSMLIFTGVYVDLQISGDRAYDVGAFVTGETTYIGMWTKFTYFSFAMMTLCGAGLDIKPRTSAAALAVSMEMLLGLFFHVYIFGIGLLLIANKKISIE
eukprot:77694_1